MRDICSGVKGLFLLFLVSLYINHVMVDTHAVRYSCQRLENVFETGGFGAAVQYSASLFM